MPESSQPRATYRRFSTLAWEGIVKAPDGTVLAACGHAHHNRDTGWSGSAMQCARQLLRETAQASA